MNTEQLKQLEKDLWSAADNLRANTDLKSTEYCLGNFALAEGQGGGQFFTKIDRAHREFNAQQVQNIAIISKLHKGNRRAFVRLADDYFAQGMA